MTNNTGNTAKTKIIYVWSQVNLELFPLYGCTETVSARTECCYFRNMLFKSNIYLLRVVYRNPTKAGIVKVLYLNKIMNIDCDYYIHMCLNINNFLSVFIFREKTYCIFNFSGYTNNQ